MRATSLHGRFAWEAEKRKVEEDAGTPSLNFQWGTYSYGGLGPVFTGKIS
jgi:hypothetical protein